MFIVTTTFTRDSADTPYYIDSDTTLKAAFLEFVIVHSGYIKLFESTQPTPLQSVSAVSYQDEASFTEFMSLFNAQFPTFFQDRAAYCTANGIEILRQEA